MIAYAQLANLYLNGWDQPEQQDTTIAEIAELTKMFLLDELSGDENDFSDEFAALHQSKIVNKTLSGNVDGIESRMRVGWNDSGLNGLYLNVCYDGSFGYPRTAEVDEL